MRAKARRIAFVSLAALIVLSGALAAQRPPARPADADADELARKRRVLNAAMANKLHHAQELVRALAVEDFKQLEDSARSLRTICQDTLWKASPNLTYVKHSTEFASATDELARWASANDLNAVTMCYVRVTISCVECHKFVRDHSILGEKH